MLPIEKERLEQHLVTWLLNSHRDNKPVSKTMLLNTVQMAVKKAKLKTSFKDGRPGNVWFSKFKKRHNLCYNPITRTIGPNPESQSESEAEQTAGRLPDGYANNHSTYVSRPTTTTSTKLETAFMSDIVAESCNRTVQVSGALKEKKNVAAHVSSNAESYNNDNESDVDYLEQALVIDVDDSKSGNRVVQSLDTDTSAKKQSQVSDIVENEKNYIQRENQPSAAIISSPKLNLSSTETCRPSYLDERCSNPSTSCKYKPGLSESPSPFDKIPPQTTLDKLLDVAARIGLDKLHRFRALYLLNRTPSDDDIDEQVFTILYNKLFCALSNKSFEGNKLRVKVEPEWRDEFSSNTNTLRDSQQIETRKSNSSSSDKSNVHISTNSVRTETQLPLFTLANVKTEPVDISTTEPVQFLNSNSNNGKCDTPIEIDDYKTSKHNDLLSSQHVVDSSTTQTVQFLNSNNTRWQSPIVISAEKNVSSTIHSNSSSSTSVTPSVLVSDTVRPHSSNIVTRSRGLLLNCRHKTLDEPKQAVTFVSKPQNSLPCKQQGNKELSSLARKKTTPISIVHIKAPEKSLDNSSIQPVPTLDNRNIRCRSPIIIHASKEAAKSDSGLECCDSDSGKERKATSNIFATENCAGKKTCVSVSPSSNNKASKPEKLPSSSKKVLKTDIKKQFLKTDVKKSILKPDVLKQVLKTDVEKQVLEPFNEKQALNANIQKRLGEIFLTKWKNKELLASKEEEVLFSSPHLLKTKPDVSDSQKQPTEILTWTNSKAEVSIKIIDDKLKDIPRSGSAGSSTADTREAKPDPKVVVDNETLSLSGSRSTAETSKAMELTYKKSKRLKRSNKESE